MEGKTKNIEEIGKNMEFVFDMQYSYSPYSVLIKDVQTFLRKRGYDVNERVARKGVEIMLEGLRERNSKETEDAIYCMLRCDSSNKDNNAFWLCASSCYEGKGADPVSERNDAEIQ